MFRSQRNFRRCVEWSWAVLFFCLLIRPAWADDAAAVRVVPDIPYRDEDGQLTEEARARCRIDLLVPTDRKDFPTILWFHGGGLTQGQKSIPESLKSQGVAIAAVGYRLSPTVKVEQCVDDAAAATAWILGHIQDYGGSPERVVISGHSAGGYLSMMVGLDRKWLRKYGVEANRLAGIAPLSGQAITHFTARAERGIERTQPVIDELAPLFHVRKDAPPILLTTGDRELELLGRYEENAYLWRMLKVVGHPDVTLIEFPGTDHGSMTKPGYESLLKFVDRVTQAPAKP